MYTCMSPGEKSGESNKNLSLAPLGNLPPPHFQTPGAALASWVNALKGITSSIVIKLAIILFAE